MPVPIQLKKFYLEHLPPRDRIALGNAITRLGVERTLDAAQAHKALEFHEKTGVPLKLAIEAQLVPANNALRNPVAMHTAKNLHSSFRMTTKGGKVNVSTSFATRTSAAARARSRIDGLHQFTAISFRVIPSSSEFKKFNSPNLAWIKEADPRRRVDLSNLDFVKDPGPQSFMLIVEVGFAKIGRKPVLLLTNAQFSKVYYTLSPSQKKIFKGAYSQLLEKAQSASGNLPLLIPSNKTVKEMLQKVFDHSPSDKVLDEFYDGFSEKRGRKRTSLKIRNPVNGKKLEGEFWVNRPQQK
ncbi:Uncharacterised protein [uncultured archaeon]|nr:Uncharacterised protein [uncultured archaeon]